MSGDPGKLDYAPPALSRRRETLSIGNVLAALALVVLGILAIAFICLGFQAWREWLEQ